MKVQCYYSVTNAFQSGFCVKLIIRHVFEVCKFMEARDFHTDKYYYTQ